VTYTVEQAMAVAMFNAGVQEPGGIIGMPMAKAKEVVRGLTQMGFDIDATRHAAGDRLHAEEVKRLVSGIKRDDGICTREGCGKPQSEHDMGMFCP
jgi:hypothetical protein